LWLTPPAAESLRTAPAACLASPVR
jgi:hypothetical protein